MNLSLKSLLICSSLLLSSFLRGANLPPMGTEHTQKALEEMNSVELSLSTELSEQKLQKLVEAVERFNTALMEDIQKWLYENNSWALSEIVFSCIPLVKIIFKNNYNQGMKGPNAIQQRYASFMMATLITVFRQVFTIIQMTQNPLVTNDNFTQCIDSIPQDPLAFTQWMMENNSAFFIKNLKTLLCSFTQQEDTDNNFLKSVSGKIFSDMKMNNNTYILEDTPGSNEFYEKTFLLAIDETFRVSNSSINSNPKINVTNTTQENSFLQGNKIPTKKLSTAPSNTTQTLYAAIGAMGIAGGGYAGYNISRKEKLSSKEIALGVLGTGLATSVLCGCYLILVKK